MPTLRPLPKTHPAHIVTPLDGVFTLRPEEWHCIVDGRVFGTWPDRGSALAGMATEQRRAAARKAAAL